jgi:6-phosphogluconolactonase
MNSTTFASADQQAKKVAEEVAAVLNDAISTRGQAFLAVSGGKSPIKLFHALRTQSIAWHCVIILLVDERWVPPDHERSNEKLVRVHLMQEKAVNSTFVSVYEAGTSAVEAAHALSNMFRESSAFSDGVDVAILGMGDDGHTASWFPRSAQLQECFSSPHAYATVSPEEGRDERVTMTLSAVANAIKIILCVEGDLKRAVLAEASGPGSAEQYPVRAVLQLPDEKVNIRLA